MKKLLALSLLATTATLAHAESQFDKPGFVTQVSDGRLWVFQTDSPELADFKAHGEPEKSVAKIGDGPDGMTLKSTSMDVLDAYVAAK